VRQDGFGLSSGQIDRSQPGSTAQVMRSLAQQFRDRQRFQRWACIVGLVSQPFWFWSVWVSGQWGVGVVAVVCALAWLKGLWIHWLAPRPTSGLSILQLPPESRLK
jgi:hypothetical protein